MDYAKGTTVDISRPKAEIEFLLQRAGATNIFSGVEDAKATAWIMFVMQGCPFRESIRLPKPEQFPHTATGLARKEKAAQQAYVQACKERFRGLVLLIKAKLLAISTGDRTWQQEFFPAMVLPSGRTVYEELGERAIEAVASGQQLALMPGMENWKS